MITPNQTAARIVSQFEQECLKIVLPSNTYDHPLTIPGSVKEWLQDRLTAEIVTAWQHGCDHGHKEATDYYSKALEL
jgi:hypothetical protein